MIHSFLRIAIACIAMCMGVNAFAQTTLTPGDVAIVGYNYDDPDQLVFVALSDISSGTSIKFTDSGWNGTALATNEGTWTYTVPTAISAGTTVSLTSTTAGVTVSGSFTLSTSGDQLFVYQGTASSPTFIFGFTTTAWVTGSISTTTSRRPSTLTVGSTALALTPETDNGYYTPVSNSGTKAALLTSICTSANWTKSNSRYAAFPSWSFTVSGSSPFATEPTNQPTNLTFTSVQSWNYNANWTSANPAVAGVLVLRKNGGAPSGLPVDGTVYKLGDQIGDAKVAYVGTANTFNQKGIYGGQNYFYAIYAYNGSTTSTNYKQTAPLTGSVSTPSTQEGVYYSTVDPTQSNFISTLQTRVRSPYTKVSYDLFDETMVANYAFVDTTNGQKGVTCVYSGQRYNYTAPFAWTPTTPFSREHTWCHSWMPSYSSTSPNEYADQHHLFPVNQNNANGVRSNHPLGEVVTVVSSYLDGKYGYDAAGNLVYEPRDQQKGDAARALLYMSLRYDGVGGLNWKLNNLNSTILPALGEDPQSIALLLQWHNQDVPDAYEISRNDYIQSIQQNRNPFIDHPDWTQYINFENLSWIGPTQLALEQVGELEEFSEKSVVLPQETFGFKVKAFPNPCEDRLIAAVLSNEDGGMEVEVFDIAGRKVAQWNETIQYGGTEVIIDTYNWNDGMYIMTFRIGNEYQVVRVLKK